MINEETINIPNNNYKFKDCDPSLDEFYPFMKRRKVMPSIMDLSIFDLTMNCARAGDRDRILKNLNSGVLSSINICNINGFTLLTEACDEGLIDCVVMFLDLGANINPKHGGKITPLHIASQRGYIDIVKLLITRRSVINNVDGSCSALIEACEGGHYEVAACLLKAGAKVDGTGGCCGSALLAACHQGHIELVKLLLAHGASVGLTSCGSTALTAACRAKKGDVVTLLLSRTLHCIASDSALNGADGACVAANGALIAADSALITACAEGATEVVEQLLIFGADVHASVNIEGFEGSLLAYACLKGYTGIIRLLVLHGASLYETNQQGDTLLMRACRAGTCAIDTVKALLGLHFDLTSERAFASNPCKEFIELSDYRGRTPLMIASASGSLLLVEVLLDAGAAIDAVDDLDRTALFYAADKHILKLFLSRGANINAVSKFSGSALLAASVSKRWDLVAQLLEQGADLHGDGVALISRVRRAAQFDLADMLLNREIARPLCSADIVRLLPSEHRFTYPDLAKLTTTAIQVTASEDGVKLTYRDVCDAIKSGEIESFRGATREAFMKAVGLAGGLSGNALRTACNTDRMDILELLLDCGNFGIDKDSADFNLPVLYFWSMHV